MTRKKDRWVQLIPQKPADMASIVPWGIDRYLDLIEEVACDPQVSGTGVPDKEEAAERIFRSLGTDWKATPLPLPVIGAVPQTMDSRRPRTPR